MNLLATLRQKRGQAIQRMEQYVACANPEEQAGYNTAKAEVDGLNDQIKRVEEIEALKAASAQPVEVNANGSATPQREKGVAIARIVRSIAAHKSDLRRAAEYCEQTLHDTEVAKALAAGSGAAGGFLVPEQYATELIEYLRPASVVRRMGATVVPMPGGTMTWPKQTGGATATYIGENTNISATEPTFGQLKLSAKKLAALVPISNDLIRFASPAADTIVRNDLVAAIAQAEDSNFIRGDGSGAGPKGLRYLALPTATQVLACNATVNLANITQDLGKLELALMNANVRMLNLGWLLAPRTRVYLENLRDGNGNKAFPEMAQGNLKGYPFGVTTQIPINLSVTGSAESEIYLAAFGDVIIGEVPGFIIEASSEAAYHNGSAVVSAFSLDQTVIRVIAQHDIGLRHDCCVGVLKDVDWA